MDPLTVGLLVVGGSLVVKSRMEAGKTPEDKPQEPPPPTANERMAAGMQGMAAGTITGTVGGAVLGGAIGGLVGSIGGPACIPFGVAGAYYGGVTGGAAASTLGFFAGVATGKNPFNKKK